MSIRAFANLSDGCSEWRPRVKSSEGTPIVVVCVADFFHF